MCKLFATEKEFWCPSRGCVPWEGQGAIPGHEHHGPVTLLSAGCHLKLLGTAADQVCVLHSGLVRLVPVGLILDGFPDGRSLGRRFQLLFWQVWTSRINKLSKCAAQPHIHSLAMASDFKPERRNCQLCAHGFVCIWSCNESRAAIAAADSFHKVQYESVNVQGVLFRSGTSLVHAGCPEKV